MVRATIDGAKAFGAARPRAVVVASRNMVLARWLVLRRGVQAQGSG